MNGVVTLAAAVKVGSVLCYYRSCIAYTAHYTHVPPLSLFFSHISMHISETQIAIYFYIFSLFCSTIVLSMRTSCICGTLYTETTHTQVHTLTHIYESETTTQTHRQPGGITDVVAAPASFFSGA